MEPLDFPSYDFSIQEEGGRLWIDDPIRKQLVRCTPEEWVRQHAVRYLEEELQYPTGLIGVEHAFRVGSRRWRADVVCFGRSGAPLLLVECKAPGVKLNETVIDQLARYNRHLNASALYVTNGHRHLAWRRTREPDIGYEPLGRIPTFDELRRL